MRFSKDRICALSCAGLMALSLTLCSKQVNAEDNGNNNQKDGTQTLVLVLAIAGSAAGLGGYIVKVTNAVNQLEKTLQKQISTETFALSEKIIKSKDEHVSNYNTLKLELEKKLAEQKEALKSEISTNKENIATNTSEAKIKYLEILNEVENTKRDFINLQQSLQALLRQQDCRIQDLEGFIVKKLEYHPRNNTVNLDIEGL